MTGAGRGIGRGIALQLGQAGATVYITGRTAASLQDTARDIKGVAGPSKKYYCDDISYLFWDFIYMIMWHVFFQIHKAGVNLILFRA